MTSLNIKATQTHFIMHDPENKLNPCKIDTNGSMTRVWCPKHNGAYHSCALRSNDDNHNAMCYLCCSEQTSIHYQHPRLVDRRGGISGQLS